MKQSKGQICNRCVIDTSDPDVVFCEKGICQYCKSAEKRWTQIPLFSPHKDQLLAEEVGKIKSKNQDSDYDCVMGLSGGLDSSYAAYNVKQLGLRPLVIHLDNGWNSELAVENIENIVKTLEFDLQTYVIDWEEFKDLQRSFIKASVIDIEVLTDHAITSSINKIADEFHITHVVSGTNMATESIMPPSWSFNKMDSWNIRSIHKQFGSKNIKFFPIQPIRKLLYYRYVHKIERFEILNYVDYNKAEARAILEKELDWRDYGGKHYESVFTKFYQAHMLPVKFGVDKRRAHFSSLIVSNQLTREKALDMIDQEFYEPDELLSDTKYVTKKLGFTEDEFQNVMNQPPKRHLDYPSFQKVINSLRYLKNFVVRK